MTRYVALLRAINVGGKTKVAMADLRRMFTDLGFDDVATILQTGNVIFTAEAAAAPLARQLEASAAATLGLKTTFLLRRASAWQQLIDQNPFPAAAQDDPAHLVVLPLADAPAGAAAKALTAAITGREEIAVVGDNLYAIYPDGIGRSKLTMKVIEQKLGTVGTGRNWNTVLKIAAALAKD